MTERSADNLDRLITTAPEWITISSRGEDTVQFCAQPPRGSGRFTRAYTLTIKVGDLGTVTVQETEDHRILPMACPDRHINFNSTFCVGLRAEASVSDEASAKIWWQRLEVFLTCQETAHETGNWPPELQLSHGPEAAEFQLTTEKLAKELGHEEVYKNAVAYDIDWIAEGSKQISPRTGRLIRKGLECPCGYKKKNGRTKRRYECARDNDPCLPVLEADRRKQEQIFWEQTRGFFPCCETMKKCPLRSDVKPTQI